MKTTYWIWKQPPNSGETPIWQEITGNEFLALVRSPASKNRHFIKLHSTDLDGKDGVLVMEATRDDFINWKREKNHSDYLKKFGSEIDVVSYHTLESDDSESFGEEMLRDDDCDVEADYMAQLDREIVRAALSQLNEDEQKMIEYFCLSDKQGTEREYSKLTGIPRKTINDRKKRAFTKLLKILT